MGGTSNYTQDTDPLTLADLFKETVMSHKGIGVMGALIALVATNPVTQTQSSLDENHHCHIPQAKALTPPSTPVWSHETMEVEVLGSDQVLFLCWRE